jgi:hypothetical protein
MILKNYWNALDMVLHDFSYTGNSRSKVIGTSIDGYSTKILYDGTDSWIGYAVRNVNLKGSYMNVRVGSGNTQVKFTDYQLAHDLSSSLTDTSVTINHTITQEGIKDVYTLSGVNPNSSSLTISEVGISKKFWKEGYEDTYSEFLLVRELLDTPLIVPANSGFIISLEWNEG